MHKRPGYGTLIIIGGHEDKTGDKLILRALAKRVRPTGTLVVATVASRQPKDLWEEYKAVFRRLGVRHLAWLDISERGQALDEKAAEILADADVVFFTGGDQLKITSQIGDTPVFERLKALYDAGGTIAGTSAGASAMTETMLVAGDDASSSRVANAVQMAPGLGLFAGTLIDQHFSERGRIGRLLGAVAQNPRTLGIGIDENTAIVVQRRRLRVIGEGAVYIADGGSMTYSNLTEEKEPDRTLSVFGVTLHVLSQSDTFDLTTRTPKAAPSEEVDHELFDSRAS
jgi:cyanophycinase